MKQIQSNLTKLTTNTYFILTCLLSLLLISFSFSVRYGWKDKHQPRRLITRKKFVQSSAIKQTSKLKSQVEKEIRP